MSFTAVYLPVDNIMLHLFIAAVFEALAVYLFQFRKIPGALMLVGCQLSKGVWVLAEAFCSTSHDLPAKLFWARFTDWTPLLLIYFWFEFILEVSRQNEKLPTAILYLVRGIVLAFVLIIGFDGRLGWYYGPGALEGQVLSIAFGPGAVEMTAFCYLLNVVCLGLSVRWIYSTKGLRRQQAIVLSITPLFNLTGNVLVYTVGFHTISPQIFGQFLSAIYVTWVFYQWRVYSILPLARDAVTSAMIDGLIVIDEKEYIVDMNPAAQYILTGLPAAAGDKFEKVADSWPELTAGNSIEPGTQEASRELDGERRFYQTRTLPLATPQGNPLGKVMIIKDITRQKQVQAKMLDQQKALSVMAERERLGRELHDGHGQLWSYINMQVESTRALLRKNDFDQADLVLEKLAEVTQDVQVDIRESITGLQLAAEQEGIWRVLEEYIGWFQHNYGIAVELKISDEFSAGLLPDTAEVQLLRIIQEALTNIRKHAAATQVKVTVARNRHWADIRVEDNGRGFDLAAGNSKKGSFGLKIMRERSAEIGARFKIQSYPGAGSKIILQIPLAPACHKLKGQQ